MSVKCSFPAHHGSTGSGWLLPVVVLAAAAVAAWWAVRAAVAVLGAVPWPVVGLAAGGLLLARPGLLAWRFARSSPAARRHFPAMLWHRLTWHRLARLTGIAPVELAARARPAGETGRGVVAGLLIGRVVGGLLALLVGVEVARGPRSGKVHYPRARFRAHDFGWSATIRTVPRVGRAEVEKAVPWLADAWRAERVAVSQLRPGRLTITGMRTDPLAVVFGPDDCPPGVFDGHPPDRVYLGKDELGGQRYLRLRDISGVTCAGTPGSGKSTMLDSFYCQLFASPAVQGCLLDGKGSFDQVAWLPRAWRHCGDSLADAQDVLEDAHAVMRHRLGNILELTGGHRNAWHAGPSPDLPLMLVSVDECQQYLDVAQYKGDAKAEATARRCVALAAQLIRKGRAAMCVTILSTQKATTDSLPSSLRDNSGLQIAFALSTQAAAVAALGEQIRDYPSYSPLALRGEQNTGCCIASIPSGADPWSRVRVPYLTPAWSAARAAACAGLRRDPSARPPDLVPELVPA